MKKLIMILSSLLIVGAAISQPLAFPPGSPTVNSNTPTANIQSIIANIDESTNLFAFQEIEVRVGAVYSQKTGEFGELLAIEKWDLGIKNLGLGAEVITSANEQAAEFLYLGYRKVLGNVAGSLYVGGGYSEIDRSPMGIIGMRLEYRINKHLGIFTSVNEGILTKAQSTKRGLLTGVGVSYAF